MKKIYIFMGIFLYTIGNCFAIPPGFNVQGRLTDSNGINKNGIFQIMFSVYPVETAGIPVWKKTISGVNVKNGNFQVLIQGADDNSAQIEAAVENLEQAYVEIKVGSEPPMVPRQPLLRSPFNPVNDLVGAVMWFARQTCPKGFLKADGRIISGGTHPKLALAVGKGENESFSLPDLRGEFIRGVDDGVRRADPQAPRVVGSMQTYQIEKHRHGTDMYGPRPAYGTANQFITIDSNYGVMRYTTDYGGSETRPRNVALLPCIKY